MSIATMFWPPESIATSTHLDILRKELSETSIFHALASLEWNSILCDLTKNNAVAFLFLKINQDDLKDKQCIRLTAARACSKGTGEMRMQRPAGDIHQTGRKENLG
ncbi:hypothetical protein An05g00260 [Aspergillus niger]|uniref:Uncharacterized protein n=2 Tax=Aspergillus niger TaxID=5061 RepID=A2QKH7_ASPNC|nr:hypothetical protein An05g00260 [Aspergillus niger]CAK44846.1 hypothetical protein An05g00260 [Aspergillus niger]